MRLLPVHFPFYESSSHASIFLDVPEKIPEKIPTLKNFVKNELWMSIGRLNFKIVIY